MTDVVITGFGILTNFGESLHDLWNMCTSKRTCFKECEDVRRHDEAILTQDVLKLDSYKQIPPKKTKYLDKQVVFSLICTFNAIKDAKLEDRFKLQQKMEKIGVTVGNNLAQIEFGIGQMSKMVNKKTLSISPFTGLAFYFGASTAEISSLLKTKGENATVITGANAGFDCVTTGADSIKRTQNEIVITGAGENAVSDVVYGLLHRLNKISLTDYAPFNAGKRGCFISSGGGIAILEDKELAQKRNAAIYAEVESYHTLTAFSCLFGNNEKLMTMLEKTIRCTIDKAGLGADAIDMVIPTADGSPDGDQYELMAIKNIFGSKQRFIFSPKPNVGHMLSVSGMIDLFIASMAIKKKLIPPMLKKIDTGDEASNQMFVYGKPEFREIRRVLLLQRDIVGGRIGALILKRV